MPLFLALGCTKTMEDMDNSPYALSKATMRFSAVTACKKALDPMFKTYKNIAGGYQLQVQETLNSGLFSGYFMHPGLFGASASGNNDDYRFNAASWNQFPFTDFTTVLGAYQDLEAAVKEFDDCYEFLAVGKVLKVMTASYMVDNFGPYPYLNLGTEFAPFDDPKDIYLKGFLPELDAAIDTLIAYNNDLQFKGRLAKSTADITTLNGSLDSWIKLANTIRLRLAIRISNPQENYSDVKKTAADYINKCISLGLFLDSSTGNCSIDIKAHECANPYFSQSIDWNDLVMGADFNSFLVGFKDPRMGAFFLKSDTANKLGMPLPYLAVRPGVKINSDREANYVLTSQLNYTKYDVYPLVLAAESYFLLAEASFNGYATAKTAKEYYEDGVRASFASWKVSGADAYLADDVSKPADYVDIFYPENNYSATTKITPKWNEANALEQIITQKWIAIYPDAHNAWADFRRTGFPRLKIPKIVENGSNWDKTIPKANFVNRLPYPDLFKNANSSLVTEAVNKYLNGKDDGFQRLFWQKDNNVCNY